MILCNTEMYSILFFAHFKLPEIIYSINFTSYKKSFHIINSN